MKKGEGNKLNQNLWKVGQLLGFFCALYTTFNEKEHLQNKGTKKVKMRECDNSVIDMGVFHPKNTNKKKYPNNINVKLFT